MTERIDVFISSTSRDLAIYREAVAKVVLQAGMYPIDMATFNPTDRNALQLCYDKVQEAEIFVGIYAHRYGYAPGPDVTYTTVDGETLAGDGETSITHFEYLWAVNRNLPLILFVVNDTGSDGKSLAWPVEYIEDEPGKSRLKAFKELIGKKHVWGQFHSPDNLSESRISAKRTRERRKAVDSSVRWRAPAACESGQSARARESTGVALCRDDR